MNSNPSDNIINMIIGANNSTSVSETTLGEENEVKPLGEAVAVSQQGSQGTNSSRVANYRSESQDSG